MAQIAGAARVDINVADLTFLSGTGLKGIVCVLGPTLLGKIGKAYFIGSWPEFIKYLGGLRIDDDFALYCKRLLDGGTKLYVARAGHYTDPTDKSTLVGVKATSTLTVATDIVVYTAKEVGDGYNGIIIATTAAASGAVGKLDIRITVPNNPDASEFFKDVTAAISATEKTQFNLASKIIDIGAVTGVIPIGSSTLATGAQVLSAIVDADYIGDASQANGIHTFDSVTDIGLSKIMLPHKAIPALDLALVAYTESRKDIRALLRTPVGLDGAAVVAYRERTDAYTGTTAINSWMADLYTGGLNAYDPKNIIDKDISEIADVGAIFSRKDSQNGEWFTAAGPKRGRVSNVNGVVVNFGSPALQGALDNLDAHGVNAVINHATFGPVLWGNNTLYKVDSLLKKSHIADLTVYLRKQLKPLIESELFDPNDPTTWRAIYRKIKPFMNNLADRRAFSGGEGDGWAYYGDQQADQVKQSELMINNVDDLQAGLYKIQILFKPVGELKYVVVTLALLNNSVTFEDVTTSGELL